MGIVKAGIAAALVAGIGLGLALGWRLNELTRGPLRGEPGPRSREEEEAGEASPGQTAPAVQPAQPAVPLQPAVTANDLCDLDSQACPPDLIPGSEGWARRRQEHVKAVLGEETPDQVRGRLYRTLEALIRWCWGAPVEEARAGLPLGRSGFYWRLEQALTRLPQLLEDGRCHNGRRRTQVEAPTQPEAEMEEEIAGRIVEMVVGQPGLSPAQVSQRLQEQDGTWSDPQRIADYLCQARLVLYAGSPYRQEALPTLEVPDGRSSRYAAQLLSVPALERLGLYEAAPQLSVDAERALYGPVVRCHTLLFALGSGKSRLSQSLPWT